MAKAKKGKLSSRQFLAGFVTIASIFAVLVLAGLSIFAKNKDQAKDILSTVLPLLGTWVGTVLAYYFSRDNFEAASRSVEKFVKQATASEKLAATLARDKWIKNDPNKLFSAKEPLNQVVLAKLLSELTAKKLGNRVPVFDQTGKLIRHVVHRSLIDGYVSTQALGGKAKADLDKLTIEDLLADAALKKIAASFVTVDETANLADVKKKMDEVPDCQDAFVTRGGQSTDEVLGWVTNVILEENSKV